MRSALLGRQEIDVPRHVPEWPTGAGFRLAQITALHQVENVTTGVVRRKARLYDHVSNRSRAILENAQASRCLAVGAQSAHDALPIRPNPDRRTLPSVNIRFACTR